MLALAGAARTLGANGSLIVELPAVALVRIFLEGSNTSGIKRLDLLPFFKAALDKCILIGNVVNGIKRHAMDLCNTLPLELFFIEAKQKH